MKSEKPKKRNKAARALTSTLFRQRKRPSKKLYCRRARTKTAGLRDQAGGSVFTRTPDSRLRQQPDKSPSSGA